MCSSHAHREIIRSTPRHHSAATGKVTMVGTGGIVCISTFQYDHNTYLSYLTFWSLTIRTCLMDTSGIGGYSSASQRMTYLAARHNGGRQRAMVMCNPHKHVSLPTPHGADALGRLHQHDGSLPTFCGPAYGGLAPDQDDTGKLHDPGPRGEEEPRLPLFSHTRAPSSAWGPCVTFLRPAPPPAPPASTLPKPPAPQSFPRSCTPFSPARVDNSLAQAPVLAHS